RARVALDDDRRAGGNARPMINPTRPRGYGSFVQYRLAKASAMIRGFPARAPGLFARMGRLEDFRMIYRTHDARSLLPVLTIVALALAGGGGCASQGEKMVDSFTRTR